MIGPDILLTSVFAPFALFACAIALVVLRASGSRVFFDIVGTFQATQMITDAQAAATVLESLYMDSVMAIQESAGELAEIFTGAIDNVIPLTREIENARIEFEKFVDSSEDAKLIEQQIQEIGLAYGFAADEAFRAGARMAQLSGVLGGGTTPVGTELGMMFGLISGMDTEAAMQRLINLNQQTKFMTKNVTENMTAQEKANQIRLDSTRILDQLNTVENRSAATMKQITFVMNQFASQAHLTNESIAAMAAMSATLIEAGEEQGKGGRALRMIYARLGADTNGARTAIENLGIAVITTEGEMIPFSKILQKLAIHYQTLGGAEKLQLAQSIAGNRHYTRLIKLLENVDRVRELELEALMAQFPARDELQRRLDSEIFAYEQAEAALKNYSAAFGSSLLPNLTAVTEQQALFYKTLTSITEGPLGFFIGHLVTITKLMQNFIGPTFAAVIAITNMRIALQTQHLVMRALRGDVLAQRGGLASMTTASFTFTQATRIQTRTVVSGLKLQKVAFDDMTASQKIAATSAMTYQRAVDNTNLSMATRIGKLGAMNRQLVIAHGLQDISVVKYNQSIGVLTANASALDVNSQARLHNLSTHKIMQQQGGTLYFVQKNMETALILGNTEALNQEQQMKLRGLLVASREVAGMSKNDASRTKAGALIRQYIVDLKALNVTIDEVTMKSLGTAQASDILGNKFLANSMKATMYGMKLGGLGTMFMMFGKSDKSMRVGMILTTAAMIIQMRQVMLSIKVMIEERAVKAGNIATTEMHTYSTYRNTKAIHGYSMATLGAAKNMFLFDKSMRMVIARTAVLIIAIYAIEKVLDFLGVFKMPDMTTDMDAMAGSVADTGQVIEYLKLSSEELNAIITKNEELLRTLGDAADSTGQQLKTQAEMQLVAGYAVIDMWALQRIDLKKNKDRVEELMEAQKTLSDMGIDAEAILSGQRLDDGSWAPVDSIEDSIIEGGDILNEKGIKDNIQRMFLWGFDAGDAFDEGLASALHGIVPENIMKYLQKVFNPFQHFDETFFPEGGGILNWFTGGSKKDRQDALNVMEDFAYDFNELSAWAAEKNFDNFEAALSAFEAYVGSTAGFTDDELTGGMIGAMSAAKEEIYSFNNAREELFFGFSSDRLTGDLIRQVHQQGVETLITTTEIIMTNNFNGMTVPEVADQIIAEIESRGNIFR